MAALVRTHKGTQAASHRKLVSGSVKKARKLVDQADETLEHCLPVMFQQRVRTGAYDNEGFVLNLES